MNKPTEHDQQMDQLIDMGLKEVAGHSAPPDLTERIIAVATQESEKIASRAGAGNVVQQRQFAREILAAGVLLAVAIGGYFLGGGAHQLQWLAAAYASRTGENEVQAFQPSPDLGLPGYIQQPYANESPKRITPSESFQYDDVEFSAYSSGPTGGGRGLPPPGGDNTQTNAWGFTHPVPPALDAGREFWERRMREQVSNFSAGNAPLSARFDADSGDRSGQGTTGGGQSTTFSSGANPNTRVQRIPYTNPTTGEVQYYEQPNTVTKGNFVLSDLAVMQGQGGDLGVGGEMAGAVTIPLQNGRIDAGEALEQLLGDRLETLTQENLIGDRYREIEENRFLSVSHNPLSTFSIDVDTASYAKARRMILQQGVLPPPESVRIEEFVNYFSYDYPRPTSEDKPPFAVNTEVAACPWQPEHHLLRVALAGREIDRFLRPRANLVFLLDVSGSMDSPDKLPLVKAGLRELIERLGENDRVAIVVYAGASGMALPSTPGTEKARILSVLNELRPEGSTNGVAGLELAYQLAEENFISNGTNRVILCTDGDFNVGVSSDGGLVRLVEEKAKTGVFLTALGFGIGNHNDSMLEQIADNGNGSYGYIDSQNEAHKVFAEQMSGTLVTIAKDVKIQVEFNPALVAGYRLVGYENRMLATEDFEDDSKDAGEIGAGLTVTALYEIIPAGEPVASSPELKYQRINELTEAAAGNELASISLRYKDPQAAVSQLLETAVSDPRRMGHGFVEGIVEGDFLEPMPVGSDDMQFAAAVASFAMILRGSAYQGQTSFDAVLEMSRGVGADEFGYRAEFVQIVEAAQRIQKANAGEEANAGK